MPSAANRTTVGDLRAMKGASPIVMITAYDAWMASLVDRSVDCILVGDSLGVVVQGHESTAPVTLDELVYHTRLVARGSNRALIITDLPLSSYRAAPEDTVRAATLCVGPDLAQAVKLEGGRAVAAHVAALVAGGVPVVGHLGVSSQTEHAVASTRTDDDDELAAELLADALALEAAGVFMLVLVGTPVEVTRDITGRLGVPTIGIGAGPRCDGQVQVFHDLLGLREPFAPAFARPYARAADELGGAVGRYAADVRGGRFESNEH